MREQVLYRPDKKTLAQLICNEKIITVFTRSGSYTGYAMFMKNSIKIGDTIVCIDNILSVRFHIDNGVGKKSYYDYQGSKTTSKKR